MTGSLVRGAIAAGHRLTAEAGALMLREGGTALDAGIAALAMACVCEPVLSSPGGGGFAMLRDGETGKVSLIDFFPQTPRVRRQEGADGFREIVADFGTATQRFHIGPATVATPGFFAGMETLKKEGAAFSFADLFAPAFAAARKGVVITPYQHYLSTVVQPILMATGAAADLFVPGGAVPAVGETFRNPGIAEAFEILARDGFSGSDIGSALVEMQTETGNLTKEDLRAYEAVRRDPLTIGLDGATVHLNPLPAASGTIIAYALKHLDGAAPADMARALDRADRARRDAGGDLTRLITQPVRQKGTTHISVVDANENACSITVSNGEGNGEIVGDFGFMPNNILGEEDVNPHGAGDWPRDARLASMMCPTIVTDETAKITVLGSGGSNRIRSAIFQAVTRLCRRREPLRDAINAARLHVEGGHLDFEDLFEAREVTALKSDFADHRAWPSHNMFFGGVHAVSRDDGGRFSGIGDGRREGAAVVVG
jgi:gamma-glutamyltranspeptidase/glutathione hydrolase